LRTLAKAGGNDSIYQIAKMAGRDYRRVHDDIKDFVEDGMATVTTKIRNGRLSSVPRLYGIHLRLSQNA
jgi:predicted transcriptional regulator